MTYIAHTARPPTTNDARRAKRPENTRFEGRRPRFRASNAPQSDQQPPYNEPPSPVSAQGRNFRPLAPLTRREPHSLSRNPQPTTRRFSSTRSCIPRHDKYYL